MNGKAHEEKAAITIQARVRGHQIRKQQEKVTHGITKLQALQRGRYTRREYAKLVQFQQQQETFLEDTKRRQMRIWQQEQELYFLQHTSASEYVKVRDFQKNHGAKVIQRKWRSIHGNQAEKTDQIEFDPYVFQPDLSMWEEADRTKKNELYGTIPTSVNALPSSLQDMEVFRTKRKFLEERIKQLAREKRQKEKLKDKSFIPTSASDNSTVQERRRQQMEKIQQLLQAQDHTKKRLDMYKSTYKSGTNQEENDELRTAQLCASVQNRLQALSHPKHSLEELENLVDSKDLVKYQQDFLAMSYEEKENALQIHNRLLKCATNKQNWWQTFLAGEERDIRTMYTISPWDSKKKVWQWPLQQQQEATEKTTKSMSENPEDPEDYEDYDHIDNVKEISDFFGYAKERPKDDVEASKWWKAHANQDAFDEAKWMELLGLPDQDQQEEEVDPTTATTSAMPSIAPEVIMSPNLYNLLQSRDQFHPEKYLEDLKQKISSKATRIASEALMQMELNTQQKLRHVEFQKSKKIQKTRHEKAALTIQRHFRGLQGRNEAKEIRAEFFVMVKGRAIRKGKCEECGDANAVLECRECNESSESQANVQSTALHFCPNCWVHVHSTRRRKNHVAYPMTAPTPAPVPPQSNGLLERTSSTGRSFRASRIKEADTADSHEPIQRMLSSLRINEDDVPLEKEKKPTPSKFQLLFNKESTPEKPQRHSSPQLQKPKEPQEPAKGVQWIPSKAQAVRLQRDKKAMAVRTTSPKASRASTPPRCQTSPNSSTTTTAAKKPLRGEGRRLLPEEEAARIIQKARRLSITRQQQKTSSAFTNPVRSSLPVTSHSPKARASRPPTTSTSSIAVKKMPSRSLDPETAAKKIQRARRLSVSRKNETPPATGTATRVSSPPTQSTAEPIGSQKKGVRFTMDPDTAAKKIQRARRNSLCKRTK